MHTSPILSYFITTIRVYKYPLSYHQTIKPLETQPIPHHQQIKPHKEQVHVVDQLRIWRFWQNLRISCKKKHATTPNKSSPSPNNPSPSSNNQSPSPSPPQCSLQHPPVYVDELKVWRASQVWELVHHSRTSKKPGKTTWLWWKW